MKTFGYTQAELDVLLQLHVVVIEYGKAIPIYAVGKSGISKIVQRLVTHKVPFSYKALTKEDYNERMTKHGNS